MQAADSCISRGCFACQLSQFVEASMDESAADTAGIVVGIEIAVAIESHMAVGKFAVEHYSA